MQKRGTALRAVQEEVEPDRGAARAGAKDQTPALAFTPVPRRYRHDGWTPARQVAFIDALADTGCVSRAARMVNMAQANCYTLRRAPGAESFRRAWDAALDFGLKRLKDIAFERAIEGQLVPVFVGGKLMGFRRKRNDALLMFCLRHYGQDANGKRTTINYFSSRASAVLRDGASPGSSPGSAPPQDERALSGAQAEASTTTVRTVITGSGDAPGGAGRDDAAAGALQEFEGVALDAEAEAAIQAALEACAARAREAQAAYDQGGEAALEAGVDDPDNAFARVPAPPAYHGELEPPGCEDFVPFTPGEAPWELAGLEMSEERARIEDAAEQAEAGRPGDGGTGGGTD